MDALKPIKQLLATLKGGPGLAALELADSVSGGYIKEAAKTSDRHLGAALDEDTREAALMGLDLARLNDARFRVVLELLEKLIEVQDELTQRWEGRPLEERPELRDLQAGAALVAKGYARQQNHQRRQLIVDALRGSFCPEPYLWGFQDELLRTLTDHPLTGYDIENLEKLSSTGSFHFKMKALLEELAKVESCERLARTGLVMMFADGFQERKFVLSRTEISVKGFEVLKVSCSHKGQKLVQMISEGRKLGRKLGASL